MPLLLTDESTPLLVADNLVLRLVSQAEVDWAEGGRAGGCCPAQRVDTSHVYVQLGAFPPIDLLSKY